MYIIVYIYTHVTTYVLCFETDAKVVAAKHRQVSLTDGHMGVPQARWMVYDGKSKIFNGCELGYPHGLETSTLTYCCAMLCRSLCHVTHCHDISTDSTR